MPVASFAIILFTTVLAFSVLYAPQPLLPMLAQDLGVSEAAASLLITVTLLPLSVAPILYGYLLESVTARRVLIASCALLALTALGLAAGPGYSGFLAVRFLQGLLLPAVLTALMTYVAASTPPERVGRAMAVYVASTVFGGFAGRAFSGLVSQAAGWQTTFFLLGLLLLLATALLLRLKGDPPSRFSRVRPSAVREVLKTQGMVRAYAIIFCAFFVFAALLNFLPFRLVALDAQLGPGTIALLYTGYLMGIVVSLVSGRVVALLGSERAVVALGLALLLAATLLFQTGSIPFVFANMFLLCAGMFFVHSVLPGYVNRLQPARPGVVNGLYVAAYYAGGSAGSFLPAVLLGGLGWSAYVMALAGVSAVALVLALRSG
jgi:MFS transporter, YNFM family, putative membrane transport protein